MYPRMFGMLQYVFVGSWIWCFLCIQLNLFGMNEWIICIISLYIIYFAPGTDVGCSIEEKTNRSPTSSPSRRESRLLRVVALWWHEAAKLLRIVTELLDKCLVQLRMASKIAARAEIMVIAMSLQWTLHVKAVESCSWHVPERTMNRSGIILIDILIVSTVAVVVFIGVNQCSCYSPKLWHSSVDKR
jgi:hypothetical protein